MSPFRSWPTVQCGVCGRKARTVAYDVDGDHEAAKFWAERPCPDCGSRMMHPKRLAMIDRAKLAAWLAAAEGEG